MSSSHHQSTRFNTQMINKKLKTINVYIKSTDVFSEQKCNNKKNLKSPETGLPKKNFSPNPFFFFALLYLILVVGHYVMYCVLKGFLQGFLALL
jgi:hypothetical protein